jgi:hypothetical protein
VAALDWDASDPVGRKRIMPVLYRRVAVAAVLTVAAIAGPVAAFASGPSSPAAKPTHSPVTLKTKSPAGASRSGGSPPFGALASSAGISPGRLEAGLAAAKRAGGRDAAGITAFAEAAGVSNATGQRIVYAVFGSAGKGDRAASSLTGPSAVAALAARLGVSAGAARHALQRIGALSAKDGIDPASSPFAAIAHELGVSPPRLAGALKWVKESGAGR